ncbi:protein of unknown function [Streptomyces murinus]
MRTNMTPRLPGAKDTDPSGDSSLAMTTNPRNTHGFPRVRNRRVDAHMAPAPRWSRPVRKVS